MRLKELRDKYDLTTRALGSKTGVSYATISILEHDETSPNIKTLTALANYFNVTNDYLLGKEDIGIWVKYKYDGQEDDCIVCEDRVELAREKGCLREQVCGDYIHRDIIGDEARLYFENQVSFKNLEFETLVLTYRQLKPENQSLIVDFMKLIINREAKKKK